MTLNLNAIATDAAERVHKNGGCVPQLAFAPILFALQDAVASEEARATAWSFELASSICEDGTYTNWQPPKVSLSKPCVPEGSIRNLTALGPVSAPETGRWYAAEDIDRMVRQLDVAMNGGGAAEQARLCDIVKPLLECIARTSEPEACKGCGHVGPVPADKVACCPDGRRYEPARTSEPVDKVERMIAGLETPEPGSWDDGALLNHRTMEDALYTHPSPAPSPEADRQADRFADLWFEHQQMKTALESVELYCGQGDTAGARSIARKALAELAPQ